MKTQIAFLTAVALAATATTARAQTTTSDTVPVTVENFIRAETDLYFGAVALKEGSFEKFEHHRELASIDNQTIIRMNRDTLYSAVVIGLDAGPATVTLPDPGKRFMSLQIVNEDQYSQTIAGQAYVYAKAGGNALHDCGRANADRSLRSERRREGSRIAGRAQDRAAEWSRQVRAAKMGSGQPKKVRDALIVLGTTMTDTSRAFGTKDQVDLVQRLISAATTWGGNPKKDAIYLNFTPSQNDGTTVYKLNVKDVPVDAFWSVSLYNAAGYYEKNPYNAYSLNNLTSKKNADGSVSIQFGGCDGKIPNCLPTMKGWNYTVRLYRPRVEILSGKWKFPEAQAVN